MRHIGKGNSIDDQGLRDKPVDLSSYALEPLLQNGEFVISRARPTGQARDNCSILVLSHISDRPSPSQLRLLKCEFGLRGELGSSWALCPIDLVQHEGRISLVYGDPLAEPLPLLLGPFQTDTGFGATEPGPSMEVGRYLKIASNVAAAVRQMHQAGIIHKDIKTAHIFVNETTDKVWLTGFGIASRTTRERQSQKPPEALAGTLAYMAPEQTGRMNRSVDSRSDLYALGVTLYEMVTGSLPFTAAGPMEWVHCHIARQPVPPADRVSGLPVPISAIVMKLLAKTAGERYQTAAGLEHDLRRCLHQLGAHGRIDEFVLGEHDVPDRLLVPEKLYGREREAEALLHAFERIADGAPPELIVLSGYSGIGKSSVVNELQPVLVANNGLFAGGKFDQVKRDVPYATLAQAFQGLVRMLLAKSDSDLGIWSADIRTALGQNGAIVVDLVPELKFVIGEPPTGPEFSAQDGQRQLHLAFRRFLAVFARKEHPLVLFLDDLQWLDVATLALLEDLLTQQDTKYILFVGAYRDNEVTASHPLMATLTRLVRKGVIVKDIGLAPLTFQHTNSLIADALRSDVDHTYSLSELVHEKAGGNPFFVIQFLSALTEEKLLVLSPDLIWQWDSDRIGTKEYSENVVALMTSKLGRLPNSTLQVLQLLACFGNNVDLVQLEMVNENVEEDLQYALRTELVFVSDGRCRFVHDRIQEAAYSLIPEAERAELHLRIGRRLAAGTPKEQLGENIFEIVAQFNQGGHLVVSDTERDQLAEFNLMAARRAKTSTVYLSALGYLERGLAVLSDDGWQRRPELMFALASLQAECEFLTGRLAAAEERLASLSTLASNVADRANIASLRIDLYTALSRNDRAIEVCLAYLGKLGSEIPAHPTADAAKREYQRTWSLIGSREIEDLAALPQTLDSEVVATMRVLGRSLSPALFTDANLLSVLVCQMTNLGLEHGHAGLSCDAYVWLGMIAGPHFGDYREGLRFGELGYELLQKMGPGQFRAHILESFATLIIPWTKHLRTARDLMHSAFDTATSVGDLTTASYCGSDIFGILLAAGDPLADIQDEAIRALEFSRHVRFDMIVDITSAQLALVQTLRGLTPTFGTLDHADFNEESYELKMQAESTVALVACWYWIRKLQARYFAGDFATAVHASFNAKRLLWTSPSFIETAEAHFYGALSQAAACDQTLPDWRERYLQPIVEHHARLVEWAVHCPENFDCRATLIGAEIARLEGQQLTAQRLYEAAIKSARSNAFVHIEALASELAARFHDTCGLETISHSYLRNARQCYLRWGADGKVRQLDGLFPNLNLVGSEQPPSTTTVGSPVDQLDLATVLKVSQAISSEIVFDNLVNTLMRIAMEQAGAERALLILMRDAEPRIVAEATTGRETIVVQLHDKRPTSHDLPESVLQYSQHTQELVILDDASVQNLFSTDPYMAQRRPRSILCLPVSSQAKPLGALYLENNLTPGAFTPARTAVLKLLASQAAISIENSYLYRDLAEREARIRRLVDADIIGIFIWEFTGRILEANNAFLRMLGYDHDDLVAGRLSWRNLVPRAWNETDDHLLIQLRAQGTLQPFESEYFHKDGTQVPVLIGVATFGGSDQGVAYVLDLTERKEAQEALDAARNELAHAARTMSLGVLTASIAHEISQPLSGIITNASTNLRMLAADPPNIEGARETAKRTLRDGNRASEVIARLRALFSKKPAATEDVDLNTAARAVVELSSHELQRNRVALEIDLSDDLPFVAGDRVQLQQVILNLLLNACDALSSIDDRPRQIKIKTDLDEVGEIRLTVEDNGVGVDPNKSDQLFNAFYTTKDHGMGIGLSVSRSIIERHDGRIWASANVGQGARFTITLPAARQFVTNG